MATAKKYTVTASKKPAKKKTAKPSKPAKASSATDGKIDTAKRLIIEELKLNKNKGGLHWKEILEIIGAKEKGLSQGAIGRALRQLADEQKHIENTGWGEYRHVIFKKEEEKAEKAKAPDEELFYDPFAIWLRLEREECDRTIVFGKKRREKWMTPDVVGRKDRTLSGVINLPPEITSAEIKSSVQYQQLIQGFGQACAYRLFSHATYLVIPEQTPKKYLYRLDKLCFKFGVGLVLFDRDTKNLDKLKFSMFNRPQHHEPDAEELHRIVEKVDWTKAETKEE